MSVPRPPKYSRGTWLAAGILAALTGMLAAGCGDDTQTCDRTSDCGTGLACLEGTCQAVSCRTNLDCPADATCFAENGEQGRCSAQECRTSNDCEDQRETPYCVGGRCVADAPPECEARDQCGDGETCTDQECVAVESGVACVADTDCGNPEVCDPNRGEAGECTAPCTRHDDCNELEGRHACDSASGLCISVECLSAADCNDGEVCTPDFTCDFERFPCGDLTCDDTRRPFVTEPLDDMCRCVECLSDNNCTASADDICVTDTDCLCTDSNRCLSCGFPAGDVSECPEERPLLREGCCVVCLSDVDCQTFGLGSICQAGECVACDCLAGCECTGEAECVDQGDGTGRCQLPLGQLGDSCAAQSECDAFLACNYSSGECVQQGSGSFCGTGCPDPMRCASVSGGGGFCYGCDPDNDTCPANTECEVRSDWVDVFDGGRCTPI